MYSGDLNTGLVQYSNGPKQSDNWMVRYSGHGVNNKLFSLVFRSWPEYLAKSPVFRFFFTYILTKGFKYCTIMGMGWHYYIVHNLNGTIIPMLGIWIPTLMGLLLLLIRLHLDTKLFWSQIQILCRYPLVTR